MPNGRIVALSRNDTFQHNPRHRLYTAAGWSNCRKRSRQRCSTRYGHAACADLRVGENLSRQGPQASYRRTPRAPPRIAADPCICSPATANANRAMIAHWVLSACQPLTDHSEVGICKADERVNAVQQSLARMVGLNPSPIAVGNFVVEPDEPTPEQSTKATGDRGRLNSSFPYRWDRCAGHVRSETPHTLRGDARTGDDTHVRRGSTAGCYRTSCRDPPVVVG